MSTNPSNQQNSTDPIQKAIELVKVTFKRLFNLQTEPEKQSDIPVEDVFVRQLITEQEPELSSWISISSIKIGGKRGTTTRKWLMLWTNGEVSYVNRGTTRSPEKAISPTGKNVKTITNATASIKDVKLDGYTLTFSDVLHDQIEILLDPKTPANAALAKKYVTTLKKLI